MELKNKVETKVRNCFEGYLYRKKGSDSEGNREAFIKDLTLAMLNIVKKEINFRVQEIRHGKA